MSLDLDHAVDNGSAILPEADDVAHRYLASGHLAGDHYIAGL